MSRDAVLLLGGNGFIGSALAKRLQQDKVPAFIVGRDNVETLAQVLPQCGTVVHLASATTPGSSASQPSLELANLALTLHLLELMQAHPETHLIFFSSGGTVYGNPDRLPVTEESPIVPLSNHGAGKAAQETFYEAFRAKGHAVTILRPSNAYGPGQTMRNGFGLARTLLEHARRGTPVEIWGDGKNVRDFIYIDDIVDACTKLVNLPLDSATYNLGSGIGCSINQLISVVETVCHSELAVVYRPVRSIDVRNVVLDNSRAKARLNWYPSVALADGMSRTWEWLKRK